MYRLKVILSFKMQGDVRNQVVVNHRFLNLPDTGVEEGMTGYSIRSCVYVTRGH
jgi:hypothetical protein